MPSYYVVSTATGRIHKTVTAPTINDLANNVTAGDVVTPADPTKDPLLWTWSQHAGYELIPPDIQALRAAKILQIKRDRERVENGGCDVTIGENQYRLDTDLKSRLRISGAVQMAMLAQAANQPFVIDWTMEDNSSVTLDAAGMISVGLAVGYHTAAVFERCTSLKSMVELATTAESVESINWETQI